MSVGEKGREVAVDGVILNGKNEVLLVLRDHNPFKGYWVLPGGHVKRWETVEDALRREMLEEVGCEVEIIRLIGVFSDPNRDPRGLVSVAFLAKLKNQNIKLNNESKEYGWFPINKLPEKIGFDHREIIKRLDIILNDNNKKIGEGYYGDHF